MPSRPADDSRSPPRDAQRAAVYQAEDLLARLLDRAGDHPTVEVAGSHMVLPTERRFADLASVQTYVDSVRGLDWVRSRWPRAARAVLVRERRGASRAHYRREPDEQGAAVIALPLHRANRAWALRELVVLHELAHHLDDGAGPAHGPGFTATLTTLVAEIIGPEAGLILTVSLHDVGAR